MTRPLPYPGYTWSFTQHAIGITAKTVYQFLKCVAPFEGEVENYSDKITKLMVAAGILTPNERDGVHDAWRDYQQILVELGLIYSTRVCRALTITELGHMFLAGEVGFSELVGIQALRYQYPNGQKSTIQARLRTELEARQITLPETLIELQINSQVLIKPGTLILRVLLELHKAGYEPYLSVDECQAYLIPCKNNTEWYLAVSEVIKNRCKLENVSKINRHSRRNIQDWFKFLKESDYFFINKSKLYLTDFALLNNEILWEQCGIEEQGKNFWLPSSFDVQSRLDWFDWYGHVPYASQGLLRSDILDINEYIKDNFISGLEDNLQEDALLSTNSLNLNPVNLDFLERNTPFKSCENIEALVDALQQGAQKRHAKTLLHDRIVKQLAEGFILQGAQVYSDSRSIDLLSTWPDGSAAIFEIKTVTRRSFQGRIRVAIGQLEEYEYRHRLSGGGLTDKVIVVNTEIEEDAWQRSFLTEHLGIGLICTTPKQYTAYAPGDSNSKRYWID